MSNTTIVTGLWDLKRGDIEGWGKRNFQQYKDRFFEMLETDIPMCIFIPSSLVDEVENIRGDKPTKIFIKENEDFETWNPFFEQIDKIRTDNKWVNYAGWLSGSPQAQLKHYNAMMFTKMFMVNDSAIINPFDTDYFFWIDGGLTSTVNKGYFSHDRVLDNLENYILSIEDKFVHITYPYTGSEEIHGFRRDKMAEYCGVDFVNYVARGGFFGGHKDKVSQINGLYYNVMETSLKEGLMGADECLFTILCHRHPNLIHRFEIEGNGLVWPFFEELKEYKDKKIMEDKKILNTNNSALYVLTFNSPKQLDTLIQSFYQYDPNFVEKPKKFIINNSTDESTDEEYDELCEEYDFTQIRFRENIGICGGRQFIAEHAEENGFDFYMFFEDDMFFYNGKENTCRNGFNRYVENLYDNVIEITKKEKFDFLKFSFSEFYGDNGTQWSWYNVPQNVREELFPEKTKLPIKGTDPDAPRTEFKNIKVHNRVPYIDGEVYYSNWPQVVTKYGNRKMFLTEKWARPFEQTWMSYCFQETRKGNIRGGLLLASPTEHDRFEHYDGKLRKES